MVLELDDEPSLLNRCSMLGDEAYTSPERLLWLAAMFGVLAVLRWNGWSFLLSCGHAQQCRRSLRKSDPHDRLIEDGSREKEVRSCASGSSWS